MTNDQEKDHFAPIKERLDAAFNQAFDRIFENAEQTAEHAAMRGMMRAFCCVAFPRAMLDQNLLILTNELLVDIMAESDANAVKQFRGMLNEKLEEAKRE